MLYYVLIDYMNTLSPQIVRGSTVYTCLRTASVVGTCVLSLMVKNFLTCAHILHKKQSEFQTF